MSISVTGPPTYQLIVHYLWDNIPLNRSLLNLILQFTYSEQDKEDLGCVCVVSHRSCFAGTLSLSAGNSVYYDPYYHQTDEWQTFARRALRNIHKAKMEGTHHDSTPDHLDLCLSRISTHHAINRPFKRPVNGEAWSIVDVHIRHIPTKEDPDNVKYKQIKPYRYDHQNVAIWTYVARQTDNKNGDQRKICTPPWEEGDPFYKELVSLVIFSLLREKRNDRVTKSCMLPQEEIDKYERKRVDAHIDALVARAKTR